MKKNHVVRLLIVLICGCSPPKEIINKELGSPEYKKKYIEVILKDKKTLSTIDLLAASDDYLGYDVSRQIHNLCVSIESNRDKNTIADELWLSLILLKSTQYKQSLFGNLARKKFRDIVLKIEARNMRDRLISLLVISCYHLLGDADKDEPVVALYKKAKKNKYIMYLFNNDKRKIDRISRYMKISYYKRNPKFSIALMNSLHGELSREEKINIRRILLKEFTKKKNTVDVAFDVYATLKKDKSLFVIYYYWLMQFPY